MRDTDSANLVELTTEIVSSYISNNSVAVADLPDLFSKIHDSLAAIAAGNSPRAEPVPTPAVPIRKSITPEHIICLEDGKKFKSLRRHLRTHYNLSPEQYKQKWGLDHSYPMVAPNYAKARSKLAREMGLGQKG